MNFRYDETAHAFEDDLVEIMTENARGIAVKEAEATACTKTRASGGLDRILGLGPTEEVKTILKEQGLETAPHKITEHDVRKKLRKLASRHQRLVDEFLEARGK